MMTQPFLKKKVSIIRGTVKYSPRREKTKLGTVVREFRNREPAKSNIFELPGFDVCNRQPRRTQRDASVRVSYCGVATNTVDEYHNFIRSRHSNLNCK